MPTPAPKFNNPAGRIHAILSEAKRIGEGKNAANVWREALGCVGCVGGDVSEIYGRLWELKQEWRFVIEEIRRLKSPDQLQFFKNISNKSKQHYRLNT